MKESEGGGEVFGIVQEDLTVTRSGSLEDHHSSTGGEGVGKWGFDQLGDVVTVGVLVDDPGLLVNCSFPHGNITSVLYVIPLFIIVDCDVGIGGCEGSIFRSHRSAGDGSNIFNVDESVGHCNVRLVEEVVEEAGVFAGDAMRWGCHSIVQMLVLLCVLGFINGCFL
jgi:hypothetical protein